ncbi:MAG: PSD1 and planctomycete cytochrome C domain-containing protein [Planctomycetaceae bacterium]
MVRIRLAVATLVAALAATAAAGAEPVRFGRDVLPILSAKCFACHGPDDEGRQADLRLDLQAEATRARDGGAPIVPGKPEESTILARVTSADPDEVMPPADSHKPLTAAQIDVLRRWIADGAAWGRHWSFEPVVRPEPRAMSDGRTPASPIDAFVAARLAPHGLAIRAAAPPHALARRLALDITGLPPTPEEADAFAADPSPAAYEGLVDKLLASPAFGEHWARMWLDLARYGDTRGYEKDLPRSMWPYRDWVVEALDADMPLDRFTLEQLAGDLLPEPTERQLVATAFHRNTMANDEAGTDDEEFRVAAVKDRIDTTVQAWMGLTMGCAKCHTHKYDPISHHDYYAFFAIFDQTADADRGDEEPRLELLSAAEHAERARLLEARDAAEAAAQSVAADDAAATQAAERTLKEARRALRRFEDEVVRLPVRQELPADKRRTTRIHNRGNFLDPGAEVAPAVLPAFGGLPAGVAADRIGAARWLVSADNPLTPRVWANRVWARIFGGGLVETEEDFGALGSAPTHPELLDWLAADYRDGGWSLKKLVKAIVMSDTYRQRSDVTPALAAADPRNQLLSRGARFRLPAEMIRDQALAVSGLLSRKRGGPPVMPPQPAGLWRSTYNTRTWVDAEGEDRHRRGLYTFLKKTTPYPSFVTFDAGSGEICQVRRIRTNTPLQALVTLNDPVYLEAAGALAGRMTAAGADPAAVAARGLRLALVRPPRAGEVDPLVRLMRDARDRFAADPEAAAALLAAARAPVPDGVDRPALAAAVVVASAILNLDEVLTRN